MTSSTPLFTSRRERRLWFWALAVVVAIYSTLGLAGSLAEMLRERNLLPPALLVLMFVTVAAIVGSGLKRRPGRREIWVALGVAAVYGMAVLRMGGSIEERTHLFEYGIVAVLIYQALSERAQNDRRVPVPAVLALVATVALGWIDEGLQALIPNRVYDNFDVVRNTVAALIGISGSVVVGWLNAALDRRRAGKM
ncbi:MAG: VanZ family protein [Gemmatimonadota bacterium]|nr:VanZ family protein [Gemmatimonadota bacterium]